MDKIKALFTHYIFWCAIALFVCLFLLSLCFQATVDNIKESGGLKNIIQSLWDGEKNDIPETPEEN